MSMTDSSIPIAQQARKQPQRDWAARTIRRLKRGEWESTRAALESDPIARQDWERDAEGHLAALVPLSDDVESLKATIKRLRRQIRIANEGAHRRNLDLDALHYVWCNGGCEGGVHRWTDRAPLTEELVSAAENNTERMRTWLRNYQYRQARKAQIEQGLFPKPPYPHKRGLRFSVTLTRERAARLWRWLRGR
jgi:hypothetical protein